jgi:hypothetical protein
VCYAEYTVHIREGDSRIYQGLKCPRIVYTDVNACRLWAGLGDDGRRGRANERRPEVVRAPYSVSPGPNHQLGALDFPLSRLADPDVRGALDPTSDSNDAVSSQGIHHPGNEQDPQGFFVGSANTRRVEPRNTPSMLNAVFNHRSSGAGAPRMSSTASITSASAIPTPRSFAPTTPRTRSKCGSS